MQKSILDMVMSQIGPVARYLPKGMRIMNCDMHGSYLAHYKSKEPVCPVCKDMVPDPNNNQGNGPTASEVEHYIDITHTGAIYGNTSGSGVHGQGK